MGGGEELPDKVGEIVLSKIMLQLYCMFGTLSDTVEAGKYAYSFFPRKKERSKQ